MPEPSGNSTISVEICLRRDPVDLRHLVSKHIITGLAQPLTRLMINFGGRESFHACFSFHNFNRFIQSTVDPVSLTATSSPVPKQSGTANALLLSKLRCRRDIAQVPFHQALLYIGLGQLERKNWRLFFQHTLCPTNSTPLVSSDPI